MHHLNLLFGPLAVAWLAPLVAGQAVLITTSGTTSDTCPQRTGCVASTHSSWACSYTSTVRYVTDLPTSGPTPAYVPPYSALDKLVRNASRTTWGSWLPGQTAVTANDTQDLFGEAAWQPLWVNANLTNYTTVGLYSTTVSPTPFPTEELIAPPPNYFGPSDCYALPKDFIYGGAGAAGQVEGAIGLEGRTPSLLENFITNGTGDDSNYVAAENYMLYQQDIARMAAAGLKDYAFSYFFFFFFFFFWNRILPSARANTPVNQEGIDHYDDLIETILAHGMRPIVTMHHFDSPYLFVDEQYPDRSYQARANNTSSTTIIEPNAVPNKNGIWSYNAGFAHPDFVDSFAYYTVILFTHYADRVPIWITINSSLQWGNTPVGMTNCLKAHAAAYHYYHSVINATGKVGMKIGVAFPMPEDPRNATHVEIAQRYLDMHIAVLADLIILGKQYPQAYLDTVADAVELTSEELEVIGGTADFFAANEYTAQIISPLPYSVDTCAANSSDPNYPWCATFTHVSPTTGWALGIYAVGTATNTPQYSIRACLKYLWDRYNLPVLISEFGFQKRGEADADDLAVIRYDAERSEYYLTYLSPGHLVSERSKGPHAHAERDLLCPLPWPELYDPCQHDRDQQIMAHQS